MKQIINTLVNELIYTRCRLNEVTVEVLGLQLTDDQSEELLKVIYDCDYCETWVERGTITWKNGDGICEDCMDNEEEE